MSWFQIIAKKPIDFLCQGVRFLWHLIFHLLSGWELLFSKIDVFWLPSQPSSVSGHGLPGALLSCM